MNATFQDQMALSPAAAPSSVTREPFAFTGTAREYFGIWIVNVLLTIVTLGIYSAWAKVRRQRYFYGNTHLAGGTFEYHAKPMRILVGRIIVLVLLVAYNVILTVASVYGIIIIIVAIFAVPWLIMRGLRFSARVTTYRNVRFDFTGGYWGAFRAYILGGALIYGTLGFLAPLASQWIWNYMLGNLRYGDRPISCDPRLEKLYGQWWLPAIVFVLGSIAMVALAIATAYLAGAFLPEGVLDRLDPDNENGFPIYVLVGLIYLGFIPLALMYMLSALLYRAGTRNVALSETVIDGRHALSSQIHRGRFAWIWFSNLFVTVMTLGLARPWAAIRMARYLSVVTWLDTTGSLDSYVSGLRAEGGATGSEFLDVEGFDLGF